MLKYFVFLGQIFIELQDRRDIAATDYPKTGKCEIQTKGIKQKTGQRQFQPDQTPQQRRPRLEWG
jgi:hypothetical protein